MESKRNRFQDFVWSTFDDSQGARHDGPDQTAISCLSETERAEAERMILNVLEQTEDYRPIMAAGMMRLVSAAPILWQRLEVGFRGNANRIFAAQSLFLINGWSEAVDIVIGELNIPESYPHRSAHRTFAVNALADFGKKPEVLRALFQTVEDDDSFVGFLATGSLRKIYAEDKDILELLNALQKAQIKPVRNLPESLEKRKTIFSKLEKLTNITMPEVRKREKEIPPPKPESDEKQLPLI